MRRVSSCVVVDHWREIVENGAHELRRDFDGVTLTISRLDIPGAWACFQMESALLANCRSSGRRSRGL